MEKAIRKALEGEWKGVEGNKDCIYNFAHVVVDPLFWQCLGKAEGWGQKLYKVELGSPLCLHCGIHIDYQPTKESGCNHVHYPEACERCSEKAITWQENWHKAIDHLIAEKPIDEFFNNLLQ